MSYPFDRILWAAMVRDRHHLRQALEGLSTREIVLLERVAQEIFEACFTERSNRGEE